MLKMKTKKMQRVKKKPNEKQRRTIKEVRAELTSAVRTVFETEARDTILLGEIRSALADPKRREDARTRIIYCLFRGRTARVLAKVMASTRPAWMSELSYLRLKRAVKRYRQSRKESRGG